MSKIRIFVESELDKSLRLEIKGGNFEYLAKVMRRKLKDEIFLFNGVDGEFLARIDEIGKKKLFLEVEKKVADLKKAPNISLVFAPVKNVRMDFIAAKAVEMGVARFVPVVMQHSVVDKINISKFKSNVKEALEQCGRNDFPDICQIVKFTKFLEGLNKSGMKKKAVILCDESGAGMKASKVLPKILQEIEEVFLLIGPEGGFAAEEFKKIRALPSLYSLNLGPRILRADTAAIAALAMVQEFWGDFDLKPAFVSI